MCACVCVCLIKLCPDYGLFDGTSFFLSLSLFILFYFIVSCPKSCVCASVCVSDFLSGLVLQLITHHGYINICIKFCFKLAGAFVLYLTNYGKCYIVRKLVK